MRQLSVVNASVETLAAGVVHVWLVDPTHLSEAQFGLLEGLLDQGQRDRMARFIRDVDRKTHTVAHGMVRMLLGHYLSVEPQRITYWKNRHGRPEIATPHPCGLTFNLSHTKKLIACALGYGLPLGVDVEYMRRPRDILAIAERFFAASEFAEISALQTTEQQHQRFFDYWTLKESYIKARGTGLAIPLNDFWFDVSADTPAITIAPSQNDNDAAWQFALQTPTSEHRLATAIKRGSASDLRIEVSSFSQLLSKT